MTETTATPTNRRSTRRAPKVAAAITLAVALGALGAGCSDSKDDASTDDTFAELSASGSADTSTTAATGTDAGSSGGTSPGGTTGGGSTSGGGTSGGATGVTPVINSFTTPENIDCHNGNSQMFTASWSTSNATKVTISIDGPGIYDTYGPSGETSLPFSCSSSHTFLLTATSSDGTTATRQVTLQPRNVQAQGAGDEEQ
jgi:hypothetical protein